MSDAALLRWERFFLFLLGAVGYGAIEIGWRGYTHWSMLLCGGLAVLYLHRLSRSRLPFWGQCLAGALGITGVELAVGLLLNRWLGLAVWDYSALPGNLWGQICPAYSLVWLALSALVLAALHAADRIRHGPLHLQRRR